MSSPLERVLQLLTNESSNLREKIVELTKHNT